MHKKYAKDGLAVISVCTDVEDAETKARTVKFLKEKGATFVNLALDEDSDVRADKLRFTVPPCYYVFSRQGRWTMFTPAEDSIDHDAVEKLVRELLNEK